MTSDAQRKANKKQDATRKRVAIWLDEETAALLDKRRKKMPRAEFIRRLIQVSDKLRGVLKGVLDD